MEIMTTHRRVEPSTETINGYLLPYMSPWRLHQPVVSEHDMQVTTIDSVLRDKIPYKYGGSESVQPNLEDDCRSISPLIRSKDGSGMAISSQTNCRKNI